MTSRALLVRLRSDDGGSAIVEFVFLAVLLMVPLVYVLLTVFKVQGASYAVSSAAREAGRVYATADDESLGADRAVAAAAIVMADSGLVLDAGGLQITCSAQPCHTPGARIEVEIAHDVVLPLVPSVLDGSAPASVHVTSRHVQVVDRFRAVG